jgi:hypothetical protein
MTGAEVFIMLVITWLVVSPDQDSLTLTRGVSGAVRAGARHYTGGSQGGSRPTSRQQPSVRPRRSSSSMPGSGQRFVKGRTRPPSMAAVAVTGWTEGVQAARKTREEGRDIWSRTATASRFVGRGLRHGYYRARRRWTSEDVHQIPSNKEVEPGGEVKPRDVLGGEATFRSSGPSGVDLCNGCDDHEQHTPCRGLVRAIEAARQRAAAGELVDDRQVCSGCEDKHKHKPCPGTIAARRKREEEAAARSEQVVPIPRPGQDDLGQGDQPATDLGGGQKDSGNDPGQMRGAMSVSVGQSELANVDEVEKEARSVAAAVEDLDTAIRELKAWAEALPDRWSGTDWSTSGLDTAITGISDAASELKAPDGVTEQLQSVMDECAKARAVGEAAEEAGAKGNIDGFRAA